MPSERTPKYRHHRPSGQAIVTLNGREIYLGPWKSKASLAEYDRLIAEWLVNGRQLPGEDSSKPPLTIIELIDAYLTYSESYYRTPDGKPTSEIDCIEHAVKPLAALYGRTLARQFGPLSLTVVREQMIAADLCRNTVNKDVDRIKRLFKWAVSRELVPAAVHQALATVAGLRAGRSDARESEPVRPARESLIAAARAHMNRQVKAMTELQELTGARPGELIVLRPGDLDRSGPTWACKPTRHKTAHHGHERTIYFGPRAQQVLAPFLLRPPDAYCFSPAEAEAERRVAASAARKTPLRYGNRAGTNRKTRPARRPGDAYTVVSYRGAIQDACDKAFPPPEPLRRQKVAGKKGQRWETNAEWKTRLGESGWAELKAWQKAHRWHPHQLRHNAATAIRKQFNLEAARAVLGHHSAAVTEIYAEMDSALAASVIAKVG